MITIGIDPGLASTGLAVIRSTPQRHECLAAFTFRTRPEDPLETRLSDLQADVQSAHPALLEAQGYALAVETPVTMFKPGTRNLGGLMSTALVAGMVYGSLGHMASKVYMVQPPQWLRGKKIEYRHEEFRLVTGYKEKCSDHARDAACIALAVALGRV